MLSFHSRWNRYARADSKLRGWYPEYGPTHRQEGPESLTSLQIPVSGRSTTSSVDPESGPLQLFERRLTKRFAEIQRRPTNSLFPITRNQSFINRSPIRQDNCQSHEILKRDTQLRVPGAPEPFFRTLSRACLVSDKGGQRATVSANKRR